MPGPEGSFVLVRDAFQWKRALRQAAELPFPTMTNAVLSAACLLLQVDPERNLLYVRGQVPGPQGSFVLVRDAFRWKWAERQAAELPFPTHIGDLPPVTVAKRDGADPYRVSCRTAGNERL